MTVPEFLLGLFQRITPVGAESMGNLKVALLSQYSQDLQNMENKKAKNSKIIEKQNSIAKELDKLDEHTPEYEQKFIEFQDLERQIEHPTVYEKAMAFFDKPYVRVLLMALFAALSWWITKKITQKKEEKEMENLDDAPQFNHYNNFPPPPPYYQPYGYGYNPPYQQNNHK